MENLTLKSEDTSLALDLVAGWQLEKVKEQTLWREWLPIGAKYSFKSSLGVVSLKQAHYQHGEKNELEGIITSALQKTHKGVRLVSLFDANPDPWAFISSPLAEFDACPFVYQTVECAKSTLACVSLRIPWST